MNQELEQSLRDIKVKRSDQIKRDVIVCNELEGMELHTIMTVRSGLIATRVIGGWLYERTDGTVAKFCTFVPLSKESVLSF